MFLSVHTPFEMQLKSGSGFSEGRALRRAPGPAEAGSSVLCLNGGKVLQTRWAGHLLPWQLCQHPETPDGLPGHWLGRGTCSLQLGATASPLACTNPSRESLA